MNPEIIALLIRKQKADSLTPEIRQQYADKYLDIVLELARHAVVHSLPAWDEEVNSVIVRQMLLEMGQKYDHKKPYIEWMCQTLIPEVDISFQVRDQARFYHCIQVASKQIGNV
ncbi:hypothetical protein [Desulfosporosinus fructosivorans]|nr:hypothetical protein [Desulfosporosinus fructosivorans]